MADGECICDVHWDMPMYVSLNYDLECADQFRLLIAKERKWAWDKKDKLQNNYSFNDLSIICVC